MAHASTREATILERIGRSKFRIMRGHLTPKMLNLETWTLRDPGEDDPSPSTTPVEVEVVQGRVNILNGHMRIYASRGDGKVELPVMLVE